MNDAPLHSYVEKWLAAQPVQRLAMPFVEDPAFHGHRALAALEHEWVEAAYAIREPQVAQVKLHWWAEELSAAPAGGGRHPLTLALFAAPQAAQVEPAQWLAPLQAAMALLDAPSPSDFAEQQARAEAFHGAIARLETCWWFGPGAAAGRAVAIAVADHLLHATARIEQARDHERLPLPMAQLARHGLDRASLGSDSPARRAAVRENLQQIAALLETARSERGPLSLFRGLQMRENRRLLRRACRGGDPLAQLERSRARPAPASVFRAWSAAREWRRRVGD